MMPTAVPGGVGGRPHHVVAEPVLLVVAVAHVQPGDVHPGVDQLADLLCRADGRAEGAHDLGSTHDAQPSGLDRSKQSLGRPRFVRSPTPASDHQRAGGRRDRARQAGRPVRYSSTAAAAARPSAIAHTISDWPRPASPATKTPSALVAYDASRATLPRSSRSTPSCSIRPGRSVR